MVGYIPHGEEEDEYEMWHVIHDDGVQQARLLLNRLRLVPVLTSGVCR